MLRIKKLNNVVVKPPKILIDGKDMRPVKGKDYFEEVYANIFLCARKFSGKSVATSCIVKNCMGRETIIIVFCSTLYKDPVYKDMMAMCKAKGNTFIGYTSLKEDGVDNLQDLVDTLQAKAQQEYEQEQEQEAEAEVEVRKSIIEFVGDESNEKTPKKRKSKFLCPEYILIFDDLSGELKSKSLETLIKKNRWFKCKLIISSQYSLDLLPSSRLQLDYVLVFQGITEDKLIIIHRDADLTIEFDEFKKIYEWATLEKYNFLYIDRANGTFRKNFNTAIELKH